MKSHHVELLRRLLASLIISSVLDGVLDELRGVIRVNPMNLIQLALA